MMVRGNVGIEVRMVGGDWLGLSRLRLWAAPLKRWEDADDEALSHYSVYRIHLCKFAFGVHFPAKWRNAFRKAFKVDW